MSEISIEILTKFQFSVEIYKMPGSGTLQPPSHSLHLLYIVQTFFIFSYYLFIHNPYHHLIIIFYLFLFYIITYNISKSNINLKRKRSKIISFKNLKL